MVGEVPELSAEEQRDSRSHSLSGSVKRLELERVWSGTVLAFGDAMTRYERQPPSTHACSSCPLF